MALCININSVEFQTLKNKSGVPLSTLELYCYSFLNKYNRLPELDELPNANSESHLRDFIDVREDNSANIQHILELTNSLSIEEANLKLNNTYRDLDVDITPIVEDAIVEINHKPSIHNLEIFDDIEVDDTINNKSFFNTLLRNIARKYGINFITTNTSEIERSLQGVVADAKTAKAFVYNGNIYINTDIATVDDPLHEMMHILLGSIRYTNPELYFSLVNTVENIANYNQLARQFKDRTRQDINEEIFVREIANQIINNTSNLEGITPELEYELSYGMTRLLDSILMGKDSVRSYGSDIYHMTLKELAYIVKSEVMNSDYSGSIDLKGGQAHRMLANVKLKLLERNELKEYCI